MPGRRPPGRGVGIGASILLGALAIGACGGDDDDEEPPSIEQTAFRDSQTVCGTLTLRQVGSRYGSRSGDPRAVAAAYAKRRYRGPARPRSRAGCLAGLRRASAGGSASARGSASATRSASGRRPTSSEPLARASEPRSQREPPPAATPAGADRPGRAVDGDKAEARPACHPAYVGCLSPNVSDYDCAGKGDGPKFTGKVKSKGSDPFELDPDGNGTGCD